MLEEKNTWQTETALISSSDDNFQSSIQNTVSEAVTIQYHSDVPTFLFNLLGVSDRESELTKNGEC